jgi:hypothetical protein
MKEHDLKHLVIYQKTKVGCLNEAWNSFDFLKYIYILISVAGYLKIDYRRTNKKKLNE